MSGYFKKDRSRLYSDIMPKQNNFIRSFFFLKSFIAKEAADTLRRISGGSNNQWLIWILSILD